MAGAEEDPVPDQEPKASGLPPADETPPPVSPPPPVPPADGPPPGPSVAPPPLPPPVYPQPPAAAQYGVPMREPRGMSISGMVLGIVAWAVSLLSCFLLAPLSALLAVVGLPLSLVGLRKENARGIAIAGIALNGLGLVVLVVMLITWLVGGATSG